MGKESTQAVRLRAISHLFLHVPTMHYCCLSIPRKNWTQ